MTSVAGPPVTVTSPYQLGMLRAQPVAPANIPLLFGLDPQAEGNLLGELPSIYAVTGYDEAQEVLRDGRRFSSAIYGPIMGPVMGRTILEMDEPEHDLYRGLIQQAFQRKATLTWEIEIVTPVVDELIDQFVATGQADLARELTFPFSVNVIARLLGLPITDLPRFHGWAVQILNATVNFGEALAAADALRDYLLAILVQRRHLPGDDLISHLIRARHEGGQLTDAEIVAFCRLLLPAGAETTFRSSGNLLFGLLTHPAQLAALRDDRDLMPQAIEEGLRWECPLLPVVRAVTEDTHVAGVPLAEGTVLLVHLGLANHDERRWVNPEQFDIFRPRLPNVAFAAGGHICLGMHLARMETRVAIGRLLDRLPDLRLDPQAPPPAITGMAFRAPTALPVRFSAQSICKNL